MNDRLRINIARKWLTGGVGWTLTVKKTIGLDKLPRKGKKVAELNLDTVRELSLYSYRILYEIKSDALIEVLAVIHKRQHLEAEKIPRD